MGQRCTNKEYCLRIIEETALYFFYYSPMYLDQEPLVDVTPIGGAGKLGLTYFRNVVAGQGSAFGLKSYVPTRITAMRKFRDWISDRTRKFIRTNNLKVDTTEKDIILVALSRPGQSVTVNVVWGRRTRRLVARLPMHSKEFSRISVCF